MFYARYGKQTTGKRPNEASSRYRSGCEGLLEIGAVLGIVEGVRGGGIDGHGPRIGGGIWLLASVHLKGIEVKRLLSLSVRAHSVESVWMMEYVRGMTAIMYYQFRWERCEGVKAASPSSTFNPHPAVSGCGLTDHPEEYEGHAPNGAPAEKGIKKILSRADERKRINRQASMRNPESSSAHLSSQSEAGGGTISFREERPAVARASEGLIPPPFWMSVS